MSLKLFLLLLELCINDISIFQVVLFPNDVDECPLSSFALLRHQYSFLDFFALVDLEDLKPVEEGLRQFLTKILEGRDAETDILTFFGQETHNGSFYGIALREVAFAEDGKTRAVHL